MRTPARLLCLGLLAPLLSACGRADAPCSAADAAAGRCQEAPSAPALPPTELLPDWAKDLCERWHRPDGSCDLPTLVADYEECNRQSVPEIERLRKEGVGNRATQLAGERVRNLCLETRSWVITEQGRKGLIRRPFHRQAAK
jgi:hypothetical protein